MSKSPKYTSVKNCSSALCSMGPRQATGWLPATNIPIEMTFTPWATGGRIISSIRVGAWVMPISPGTEKPYTSASTMPTRRPFAASAQARFTVTEDFPTPPLPLATA